MSEYNMGLQSMPKIRDCCEQAIKQSSDFSFVCWLLDNHTELAFELQDEYNNFIKEG